METTLADPIMAEVRAVWDAHAARFDYDATVLEDRKQPNTKGVKCRGCSTTRVEVDRSAAAKDVRVFGSC